MKQFQLFLTGLLLVVSACKGPQSALKNAGTKTPFIWENATVYFLLTDRFQNGNKANDVNFDRNKPSGPARGFQGGDLAGISQKIGDGYFDRLGVNAIWMTPVVEQIHAQVDEGTGPSYGFHGYWTKDWTAMDPNFGTEKDFAQMVETAHKHGIRIVLDVVINHTGPATPLDPVWPTDWVRTSPKCTYKDYTTTTACTLVENLPDIRTESNTPVELPAFLVEKWKKEGRYEREKAELDTFFTRTGYPRAPRFYIIKWLTDYIRKYGIDGYRCDTAKHIEETVWGELRKEADLAFADWKRSHAAKVLDNNPFYMTGEVSGYNLAAGRPYDFGDRKVNFFSNGFTSLINFGMIGASKTSYDSLFSNYSAQLQGPLKGRTVLNYLDSHDDGGPFDPKREKPLEVANKLLLCPGQAQIYYGDETSRTLIIPGSQGDATLRAFMNWDELAANTTRGGYRVQDVLTHWQKLGKFRQAHPAVGAGQHKMRSAKPYVFERRYTAAGVSDIVVVGLNLSKGKKELNVAGAFADGTKLRDYYSGQQITVTGGKVTLDSDFDLVLLGK